MQVHSQGTRETFEAKPAIVEAYARKLTEAEASEAPLSLEARKTRLVTLLQPAKEGSICLVESFERPPLQIRRNCRGFGVLLPPLRQRLALIDVAAGDSCLSIRFNSLF